MHKSVFQHGSDDRPDLARVSTLLSGSFVADQIARLQLLNSCGI
jgi:hypothetical protein